jgi:hypothetical protein
MSYTYLQDAGEESSAASFSDIILFAPLKSNPTAARCFCNGSGTACCHDSQYGMMSARSTGSLGVGELMSSAEDSPAKTFQPPGAAQESRVSEAGCGESSQGWFAKWHPDSCSWKTRQCSLLAGLDEFSETWPQWGMMRSGVCWELTMSVLRTGENASGFSPTWPTPRSCSAMAATITPESAHAENRFSNLETIIGRRLWPTPDTCGGGTGPSQLKRNQPRLQDAVKWPTPQSRDWKDQASDEALLRAAAGPGGQLNLPRAVVKWATPQASDNRDRGNLGMPAIRRRMEKGKQIGLGQSVSDTSGALNPDWVEWLMAWPIGWTGSSPLATGRFQAWLRSHGESFQTESRNDT